jgi:thioredoxin-like negative regulator of GroEL
MNKRFNVDSLPTIIIFKDGKEIDRIKGVPMTSAVRAILNNAFV